VTLPDFCEYGEIALLSPDPDEAKQKDTPSLRFQSLANNKPNPGNSAPQ
jgi:hypothetical protein